MTARLVVSTLAMAFLPAELVAQRPVFSGGGSVTSVRRHSEGTTATGTTLGAAGTVRLGRVDLELRYAEGTLRAGEGALRREVVEGGVTLRFHALTGVALFAGPHARTFVGAEADTTRWLTWQAGVRAATPIVGTALQGHVVLWRGLSTKVNLAGTASAQGGEVGATLELPAAPLSFTLAYAIDQGEAGTNRETVERLILTAALRRK